MAANEMTRLMRTGGRVMVAFHRSGTRRSILPTLQFGNQFRKNGTMADFRVIQVEKKGDDKAVGLIQMKSQDGYNYLGEDMLSEALEALNMFDQDDNIRAVVLTGNERVFAAGASIPELNGMTFKTCYLNEFPKFVKAFSSYRKPTIAAVNGLALGGGCELAMLCDIIYAGKHAKFALPEVLIGTIPGCGGTQRLPRAVGKSKALEMCLTGSRISATEALRLGLVSKVFDAKQCVEEAIKLGDRISKQSPLIVMLCKEAVNKSFDMSIRNGNNYARRVFHATFTTDEMTSSMTLDKQNNQKSDDRREGMASFLEKRAPHFKGS